MPNIWSGEHITGNADSTDAARWRLFCHVTGWQGGAHEAAQKYNDMTAQLAQYEAGQQDERIAEAIRWRNPNNWPFGA